MGAKIQGGSAPHRLALTCPDSLFVGARINCSQGVGGGPRHSYLTKSNVVGLCLLKLGFTDHCFDNMLVAVYLM